MDMFVQNLYSCPSVSIPPPVMPVAVMRQLPKQPLQDPWKKGPLAAVTKHVFLWVACLGGEVSLGQPHLGIGGGLGF